MTATAEFTGRGPLDAPAWDAVAVTPSDSTDLAVQARALYIGGTGNVSVNVPGPDSTNPVIFQAVPAGVVLPVRVNRVNATGTTATLIVALW